MCDQDNSLPPELFDNVSKDPGIPQYCDLVYAFESRHRTRYQDASWRSPCRDRSIDFGMLKILKMSFHA